MANNLVERAADRIEEEEAIDGKSAHVNARDTRRPRKRVLNPVFLSLDNQSRGCLPPSRQVTRQY